MKKITAWPQEEFSSDVTSHFVCINTSNIPGFPSIKCFLVDYYDRTLVICCLNNYMFKMEDRVVTDYDGSGDNDDDIHQGEV